MRVKVNFREGGGGKQMTQPLVTSFFLLLLLLLFPASSAEEDEVIDEVNPEVKSEVNPVTQRCIPEKPDEPKYFYHGNQSLGIRILTTDRLTHQLSSTILQILAEEVLGYTNVTLVHLAQHTSGFDPETQFSMISSCTDHRYSSI